MADYLAKLVIMSIYGMVLAIIGVFLLSCGVEKVIVEGVNCSIEGREVVCPDGTRVEVKDGLPGSDGLNGNPGEPGVLLSIIPIPVLDECILLGVTNNGSQVWAANERMHADYYNNSSCRHEPAPSKAYCDNVNQIERHCVVDNWILFTKGIKENMRVYRLEF